MAKKLETIDVGSGDVFADLGFADAGERKLRVQLAMRLNELIAARGLAQAQSAALFGISQPHISQHADAAGVVASALRRAGKQRAALSGVLPE